jgi:hypothetical protein
MATIHWKHSLSLLFKMQNILRWSITWSLTVVLLQLPKEQLQGLVAKQPCLQGQLCEFVISLQAGHHMSASEIQPWSRHSPIVLGSTPACYCQHFSSTRSIDSFNTTPRPPLKVTQMSSSAFVGPLMATMSHDSGYKDVHFPTCPNYG